MIYFVQISELEATANTLVTSCQKYSDPILFFHFNLQGVSPGETNDLKTVEVILQTKQYLATQVSTIVYILVICHYCRMYKINLTN